MQRSSPFLFNLCLPTPTTRLKCHFIHNTVMHQILLDKKSHWKKTTFQYSVMVYSPFISIKAFDACETECKTSNCAKPKRQVLWVSFPQLVVKVFTSSCLIKVKSPHCTKHNYLWRMWCSTEGRIGLDLQRPLWLQIPVLLLCMFVLCKVLMYRLVWVVGTVKGRFLTEMCPIHTKKGWE